MSMQRIALASRPKGVPTAENFRLEQGEVPSPGPGQFLARTVWLSLDPYMRGRMDDGPSYAKPVELGDTMVGQTVSEVVASENPAFAEGDLVLSNSGWQEFAISDGRDLRRLDPADGPPSQFLGILGMPGMTAYTGLLEIGRPRPGETVVVAAAAGPVGSLVGQIARIKGARAVGIAGGAEKCAYLTETLGFDAAVDHRAGDFAEALARACPDGIDVYFENVGGAVFDAVLPLFNDFARMPVCGLVADYNLSELPSGPDRSPVLMRAILTKRLTLRGFIVWDFASMQDDFLRDVGGWLRAGRVKAREDVVEGLDNAPAAFAGMLKGANFGKLVVKVS